MLVPCVSAPCTPGWQDTHIACLARHGYRGDTIGTVSEFRYGKIAILVSYRKRVRYESRIVQLWYTSIATCLHFCCLIPILLPWHNSVSSLRLMTGSFPFLSLPLLELDSAILCGVTDRCKQEPCLLHIFCFLVHNAVVPSSQLRHGSLSGIPASHFWPTL